MKKSELYFSKNSPSFEIERKLSCPYSDCGGLNSFEYDSSEASGQIMQHCDHCGRAIVSSFSFILKVKQQRVEGEMNFRSKVNYD